MEEELKNEQPSKEQFLGKFFCTLIFSLVNFLNDREFVLNAKH